VHGARQRVADVWDDVIARWLDGDTSLPDDLQRWRDAYSGEVDYRWYPDPVVGDLRGEVAEPRLVVMGINPGVGHAELQARGGIWAERIRAQGYSRCLDRIAFDDPAWLALHGRNSPYWANLMRFATRWIGEPLLPSQILNFELYPWHSDRVEGRMDPPPDILDRYVWQPVAEVAVREVFAFGARWLDICTGLGWPLLERFGPQHEPVPGIDASWWNLAVFGMPSGQRAIVSWQPGYAGPPGLTRIEPLRRLLSDGGSSVPTHDPATKRSMEGSASSASSIERTGQVNQNGRHEALMALEKFGCHQAIRSIISDLEWPMGLFVRGSASAYRLIIPAEGSPSAMHAHRDRLYLLLDPDYAQELNEQDGSTLMKLNPTTWYVSWSAEQLSIPKYRDVARKAAAIAMERALDRFNNPGDGGPGRRTRGQETCSVCWMVIPANGECNCY
jgi:hypothetical protein